MNNDRKTWPGSKFNGVVCIAWDRILVIVAGCSVSKTIRACYSIDNLMNLTTPVSVGLKVVISIH
jgi:hypothetical protein